MATGGANIYVGRSRLRRKFRRQRQQRHRDSRKNKSSRGKQDNPNPPSKEYRKLPRDEERKQRPDSGIYSGGSDSEEQLPLLEDKTSAPQLPHNITNCEYCFYPHTPQTAVRADVVGKPSSGPASDSVDEGKQDDQVLSDVTIVPKDDFDKFWAECCRERKVSEASDMSSDEGIQSGEAGSSGEESDEEILWQTFMEKIKIWRMEEIETAVMHEAAGNEKQVEEDGEGGREGEVMNNERMKDDDDEMLLKPENEKDEQVYSGEDEAVAKLLPDIAADAAAEEERARNGSEVATAVLVEIGGDGEYKAGEDPAVWMDDDDDEDVVWQVNNKVDFSVKYLKGKTSDSHDDVVKFIPKQKETYDNDDDIEGEKTVEAALLNPWKKLEHAGNSIKKAVSKQRKPKNFMCCSVM